MSDLRQDLCSALDGVAGVVAAPSRFADVPAWWAGSTEVGHLDPPGDDGACIVDVRPGRKALRRLRATLVEDERVLLRPGTSDWVEVRVMVPGDVGLVVRLLGEAVACVAARPVDLRFRKRSALDPGSGPRYR